jgi:hypothetical protein
MLEQAAPNIVLLEKQKGKKRCRKCQTNLFAGIWGIFKGLQKPRIH